MKSPKLFFISIFLCSLIFLFGAMDFTEPVPDELYTSPSDRITKDTTFDSAQALAEWREKIKGREKEPAETVFKNIQSYKGMPAGRLLAIMKVAFNQSLGVECNHCHNPKAYDSDEKPAKKITREMRTLMRTINRELLPKIDDIQSERPVVNCTTCHRGDVKPALDIPLPPRPQDKAERLVATNLIISSTLPKVVIQVDDEFEYIGNFDFEIIAQSEEYEEALRGRPVASGERAVFVKADENKQIQKLFIVQFEGFFPHLDLRYNYNFSKAEQIGDNKYRHNTWFYNSKKLAEQNPQGEGAKTRAFLEEKGFSLEAELMMSRFVGLASEDRKNEIIIFYLETLKKNTGYSLETYNQLTDKKKQKIREQLVIRSRNSFSIKEG